MKGAQQQRRPPSRAHQAYQPSRPDPSLYLFNTQSLRVGVAWAGHVVAGRGGARQSRVATLFLLPFSTVLCRRGVGDEGRWTQRRDREGARIQLSKSCRRRVSIPYKRKEPRKKKRVYLLRNRTGQRTSGVPGQARAARAARVRGECGEGAGGARRQSHGARKEVATQRYATPRHGGMAKVTSTSDFLLYYAVLCPSLGIFRFITKQ